MQTTDAVNRVNALTQEQRDNAYEVARLRVAGAKPVAGSEPTLAQYATSADSHYPEWVTRLIRALTVIMLVVAFLPSAMRLHAIALKTNEGIVTIAGSTLSVHAAALATVIMAEIGQTIMSLASTVARNKWQQGALVLGAGICTAIALSGNALAMSEVSANNIFSFLETFAPPLLVLISAQIIKAQMLDDIERKHEANTQYATAKQEWEHAQRLAVVNWNNAYNTAHLALEWDNVLANVLRDALRQANRSSKAVLRTLTPQDWRALVIRERNAAEWWQRVETEARKEAEQLAQEEARIEALERSEQLRKKHAQSGTKSGSATGEVASVVAQRNGDKWVVECPRCGKPFTGAAEVNARNAVNAHLRWHLRRDKRVDSAALDSEPDVTEADTKPAEKV